ncbi:MAG: hypothetical protein RIC87_12960 [Kiloniellales bacterium]
MLRFVLCCLLVLLPLSAKAEETGPVVLTLSGVVDLPNRGPFDPFTDAFAARYVDPFEKAHAFTLADLRALPQESVTLKYPDWEQEVTFTGPSLLSVLKAAGASGEKLEMVALDGYTAVFKQEMLLGDKTFILAIEVNRKPLNIGGHGPLWLAFPPGEAAPAYPGDDDAGLIWALFHIIVSGKAG